MKDEYKEIFLAEALENVESLNRYITDLEKNPENRELVDAIFRITHTLKGNASGMGFDDIANMAHVVEDLFGEVREGRIVLTPLFNDVFKAIDFLSALVDSLNTGKKVRYKGLKTKLEVLIRNNREKNNVLSEEKIEEKKKENLPVQQEKKEKVLENITKELEEIIEDDLEEDNKISFSDVVQVPVRKLNNLLNLVGELTIEKDRIIANNTAEVDSRRSNEFARLQRISSDLQYSVMDVRLVQVGFLFNKFHRIVRDVAVSENKKVRLELDGTETEIDRNVLQVISDSLIHVIRNAVGHGIESSEERLKKGKKEEGLIVLRSRNESDGVVIEIEDDGKGIDHHIIRKKVIEKGILSADVANKISEHEVIMCIFQPGFSSMDEVTAISGRGVGMDVVKKSVEGIGGTIDLETEVGKGTKLILKLPSSMAVKGTLLFELQQETYAIPLTYTEAVVSLYKKNIYKIGKGLVASHLNQTISILFLKDLLEKKNSDHLLKDNVLHRSYDALDEQTKLEIVIVTYNRKYIGIVVDKLLQQKEIVEKPLEKPLDYVKTISGVTILGNGNVCLVLNIPMIVTSLFEVNTTMQ